MARKNLIKDVPLYLLYIQLLSICRLLLKVDAKAYSLSSVTASLTVSVPVLREEREERNREKEREREGERCPQREREAYPERALRLLEENGLN